MKKLFAGFLIPISFLLISSSVFALTFTVEASTVAGPGTDLIDAIVAANNNPGKDIIVFNIPTSQAISENDYYFWQVNWENLLPAITDPVIIDGTSQPTDETYNNPYGPVIEVPSNITHTSKFRILTSECTIKGLAINSAKYAIEIGQATGGPYLSNSVLGCYIGTNVTGEVKKANAFGGIYINNSNFNSIGDGTAQGRNVISGNYGGEGILLENSNSNEVIGNYIGTNRIGTKALGNDYGILNETGSYNKIGNGTVGGRNIISGNSDSGIEISFGSSSSYNEILGNYIGVDVSGTQPLGNYLGISLFGHYTQIGNGTAGGRNIICDNSYYGIVFGSGTNYGSYSDVLGNYIGVDVTGMSALPNHYDGIYDSGGYNNIGDGTVAGRNVISGNAKMGINLASSWNTTVLGNYIGLGSDGSTVIPNGENGVRMSYVYDSNVGKVGAAVKNVISGNSGKGIYMTAAVHCTVESNYIGTDSSGTLNRGNSLEGIHIYECSSPTSIIGKDNKIWWNGGDGIMLSRGAGQCYFNAITSNSISSNGGLGINLVGSNVNQDIITPSIEAANYVPSTMVTLVSGSANANAIVELFVSDLDSSGYGEGPTFLGFAEADGSGRWTTTVEGISLGQKLTATQTDTNKNTSEFSLNKNLYYYEIVTYSSPEVGVSAYVPAGSATAETIISVTTAEISEPTPEGFQVMGNVYVFDSNIIDFDIPVVVTIEVDNPEGKNIEVLYWNGSFWSDTGITMISAGTQEVTFTTTHFTTFSPFVASSVGYFNVLSSDIVRAGAGFLATIESRDISNNLTTEVYGTTNLFVDSGNISPSSIDESSFQDDGVWTGMITLDAIGERTITVSLAAVATGEKTVFVTSLEKFELENPTSATANETFLLTVEAKDASGNTTTEVFGITTLSLDQGGITPSTIEASEFQDDGEWSGMVSIDWAGDRTIFANNFGATGSSEITVLSDITTIEDSGLGVTITIPSGATSETVSITVSEVPSPGDAPGSLSIAGTIINFDSNVNNFAIPIEITMAIDNNPNMTNIAVYYWTGTEWSDAGIVIVEVTDTTVTFTTTHLSIYAPFGIEHGTEVRVGPNPFNPKNDAFTRFWYHLTEDEDTKIYITDLSGTLLWKKEFSSGTMGGKHGENQIDWDGGTQFGGEVGDGLYLYAIVQGNKKIASGKIAVIRK